MKQASFGARDVLSPLRSSTEFHQLNLRWLIRLRWVAIVGQSMVVLAAFFLFGIQFPYPILFSIIGMEMATNVALVAWARQRRIGRESIVGFVLVLDVLFLTSLLYWTGGSFNPFSLLFFIHIALAALVLRALWTWLIALLCVLCYGVLFFEYKPQQLAWTYRPGDWNLETQGMWVAFGVTAGVIAFFINKIQRALILRDAELVGIREAQLRNEKLASLATLAAGAAHEFSTPLATIALVASELQRNLEQQGAAAALLDDAQLIRDQVSRCRDILQQMSADAGESPGEIASTISAEELLARTLDGVLERQRVAITMSSKTQTITVPANALAQALRGLVNNALDASQPQSIVELHADFDERMLVVAVHDRGQGMSDEVLERVGEPFFTTKAPGKGMGLGVFLARTLVEKIGGRLTIESHAGQGTSVTARFPHTQEAIHGTRDVH
ncbi:MAG: HAMP domain-containing histidine kinase [Bradymonadaceae bacterium]|nr:HAMP domain-containing histidine kinase [Lujinxingiaceae bacterium]